MTSDSSFFFFNVHSKFAFSFLHFMGNDTVFSISATPKYGVKWFTIIQPDIHNNMAMLSQF